MQIRAGADRERFGRRGCGWEARGRNEIKFLQKKKTKKKKKEKKVVLELGFF
jgi:hypothetical protein